jgi:hypothetical protein
MENRYLDISKEGFIIKISATFLIAVGHFITEFFRKKKNFFSTKKFPFLWLNQKKQNGDLRNLIFEKLY